MGVGGWELGLIVLLVLIVFGAGKLPDVFRQAGKGIKAFKDASEGKGKGDEDDAESEDEKAARLKKREEKRKQLSAKDDLDGDPDEAKAHSAEKEVK